MDKIIDVSDGTVKIGDNVFCVGNNNTILEGVILKLHESKNGYIIEIGLFKDSVPFGRAVESTDSMVSNVFIDKRKAELYAKLRK